MIKIANNLQDLITNTSNKPCIDFLLSKYAKTREKQAGVVIGGVRVPINSTIQPTSAFDFSISANPFHNNAFYNLPRDIVGGLLNLESPFGDYQYYYPNGSGWQMGLQNLGDYGMSWLAGRQLGRWGRDLYNSGALGIQGKFERLGLDPKLTYSQNIAALTAKYPEKQQRGLFRDTVADWNRYLLGKDLLAAQAQARTADGRYARRQPQPQPSVVPPLVGRTVNAIKHVVVPRATPHDPNKLIGDKANSGVDRAGKAGGKILLGLNAIYNLLHHDSLAKPSSVSVNFGPDGNLTEGSAALVDRVTK